MGGVHSLALVPGAAAASGGRRGVPGIPVLWLQGKCGTVLTWYSVTQVTHGVFAYSPTILHPTSDPAP
jgi:hypothetical protein